MRWIAFVSLSLAACAGAEAPGPDGGVATDAAGRDVGSVPDAAPIDGAADSGPTDLGPPDAGPAGPCVTTSSITRTSTTPPRFLSAIGLYSDLSTKGLAPGVELYTPRFTLWSDGAEKARWVRLPAGSCVDNSNPDHWVVPVGARFYKEFKVDQKRIETRMIWRFGPGPADFGFAAYAWNDAETDAEWVPLGGVTDARGTSHDIPPRGQCAACHGNVTERILGFSAVQLSGAATGVRQADLEYRGSLTEPGTEYAPPGDPITVAALGYLHANCGNCHNETANAVVFIRPMDLRLSVTATVTMQTGVFRTAVGIRTAQFNYPGVDARVHRGQPDASAIIVRMNHRGAMLQMPPVATEVIDPTGVAAVTRWIEQLR